MDIVWSFNKIAEVYILLKKIQKIFNKAWFAEPCQSLTGLIRLAINGARYSIALTMSSTTFFASPNTIMVLSM